MCEQVGNTLEVTADLNLPANLLRSDRLDPDREMGSGSGPAPPESLITKEGMFIMENNVLN